jgi:hypothetical protein
MSTQAKAGKIVEDVIRACRAAVRIVEAAYNIPASHDNEHWQRQGAAWQRSRELRPKVEWEGEYE